MSSATPGVSTFRHATNGVQFKAGDKVFSEGEPGDTMFVVQQGEVEIWVRGESVEVVGPNGVVGEMALVDQQPRSASAIARTDCTLVPIDQRRFLQLVQQTPNFALELMRILAYRLRRMNENA